MAKSTAHGLGTSVPTEKSMAHGVGTPVPMAFADAAPVVRAGNQVGGLFPASSKL